MVVVPEPTTAESIEAERQSDAAFYQGIKAKGGLANEVLGETGYIFNQAGYGIAHGVNSLYNLAADSEYRSQALAGVGNALGDGIDFLGQGASALYSLASDSSARTQFATDVGYAFENRNELARSALNYVKSVDYGLLGENLAIGTVETIATLGAGKLAVQGGKGAAAFSERLVSRFGGVEVSNAVFRQTGAGGFASRADDAYDFIRASTSDVGTISQISGMKISNIQKVKNHLFYDEHLLDRYESLGIPGKMNRFDSNIDIADAWLRLEAGTHTSLDIQLLKHEAAEAWYMRKHGPSYNNSHNAAQKRFPSPLE